MNPTVFLRIWHWGLHIQLYLQIKVYDEYKYNNLLYFHHWMEINASFVSDVAIRLYNETSDKTHFPTNIFKFSKQYFCEYEFRWNSFFCFMIICFPISGKVWNGNFQHNIWIWKLLNLKCCSRVPLIHGADEKTGVSVRMTLRSIASLRYESGRFNIAAFDFSFWTCKASFAYKSDTRIWRSEIFV